MNEWETTGYVLVGKPEALHHRGGVVCFTPTHQVSVVSYENNIVKRFTG